MPLLGRGAVGGPELDVGAVPGFAIGDVNDIAGITSRGEGIGAVGVLGDAPELGTGVVGGVEVDVGAVSDGGIEEVEAFTRTGVGESVSVPIGVVGKGPGLSVGPVRAVELDVGAISGTVVPNINHHLGIEGRDDSVGAIQVSGVIGWDGAGAAGGWRVELPALGGGVVGGPELDVGASGGVAVIEVNNILG